MAKGKKNPAMGRMRGKGRRYVQSEQGRSGERAGGGRTFLINLGVLVTYIHTPSRQLSGCGVVCA